MVQLTKGGCLYKCFQCWKIALILNVLFNSKIEMTNKNFKMELRWTHKCEFKMKPICTNHERRWFMQVEMKIVHVWVESWPTNFHKIQWLELGKNHHFFPLYCILWLVTRTTSKWLTISRLQNERSKIF